MTAKCPCCGSDISQTDRPLVSLETNRIMAGGEILHLPPMETEILAVLAEAMPRPVDYGRLIARLWGGNPIDYPRDSINVRISKLRRKIEPLGLAIKTHWGRGYALEYKQRAAA